MFSQVFFDQYPHLLHGHPTWIAIEHEIPARVSSCVDHAQSEINIQAPVHKFPIMFNRMKKKALYEPVDPNLPPMQYLLKLSSTIMDVEYPILDSFLAQKYAGHVSTALPMQQVFFVLYESDPSWSEIANTQLNMLAEMVGNPTPIARPAGSNVRDVGFILFFERRGYNIATLEPCAYPNVQLDAVKLQDEAKRLRTQHAKLAQHFHFQLLKQFNALALIDFTRPKGEEDAAADAAVCCGICMDGDILPDAQCPDARCGKPYHTHCLYQMIEHHDKNRAEWYQIEGGKTLVKCIFCLDHWMIIG